MSELTSEQRQWIDALRSGEYRQGKHYLHQALKNEELFCCLGIACKLATAEIRIPITMDTTDVYYDGKVADLPEDVRERLRLTDSIGSFRNGEGEWTSLAELNDKGTPFARIADIIESKPYGLFRD